MRRGAVMAIGLFAAAANGAIKEREIDYKAGGVVLKGSLAYDDALSGKRPAVLVVHEWWGLNEFARTSARRLAAAGYVALALDMYGEGKLTHHPQNAAKFLTEIRTNLPLMKARIEAARDLVQSQSNVDSKRIAAIGYCFGGAVVLEMARAGENLRGVVSLHGELDTTTPALPGTVKAHVLVLTGGADPYAPQEHVEALDRELKSAGVRYQIVTYPGVKHSFTDPAATDDGKEFGFPEEYNADADKDSWNKTLAFLARVMK